MAVQLKRALSGLVYGVFITAGVTGCSLIDDKSEQYVNAPEGTPLKLGENQVMERNTEALPIRKIDSSNRSLAPSEIPQPPDMTSEILEENYIIEAVDDQAWVLVNDVPGRVWPSVAAYLNERGLGVAHDSTQLGVIQSDVVNFSQRARSLLKLPDTADGEQLVIVQARITPGVRRKTTEVQLRKRMVIESPDQLLQWQSETLNPVLEKELLTDLADFLKGREDTKSYSRAALGMAASPKVTLVSGSGSASVSGGGTAASIEMDVGFDRAWAEVRRALDQAEIPVVDLDRSSGLFYVDYRSEDEREAGWFSWFSDDPKPEYTFHVRLEPQPDRVMVTTGKAEDYDGNDRSQRLLSELFEFLY